MKNWNRAAVFLLFCACAMAALSQTAAVKPIEPEIIGQVYLLDSAHQSLQKLPQEQWKAVGKAGWSTARGFIQVEGAGSSFRLKAGQTIEFVLAAQNIEQVRLYAAAIKGKNRQAELVDIKNGFGRQQRSTSQGISLVITKYGESSFKLVPDSPARRWGVLYRRRGQVVHLRGRLTDLFHGLPGWWRVTIPFGPRATQLVSPTNLLPSAQSGESCPDGFLAKLWRYLSRCRHRGSCPQPVEPDFGD